MEFISAEHTPRNLLLRAVKPVGADRHTSRTPAQTRQLLEEYDALKAFWGGVSPHLETLVAPERTVVRERYTSAEPWLPRGQRHWRGGGDP